MITIYLSLIKLQLLSAFNHTLEKKRMPKSPLVMDSFIENNSIDRILCIVSTY